MAKSIQLTTKRGSAGNYKDYPIYVNTDNIVYYEQYIYQGEVKGSTIYTNGWYNKEASIILTVTEDIDTIHYLINS